MGVGLKLKSQKSIKEHRKIVEIKSSTRNPSKAITTHHKC